MRKLYILVVLAIGAGIGFGFAQVGMSTVNADVTDQEAVKFCNENIRQGADLMERAYWQGKASVNEWYANNFGAQIPNTTEIIDDGSGPLGDGRTQLTGADATSVIVQMEAYVNDMEANGNAKLYAIQRASVNGTL